MGISNLFSAKLLLLFPMILACKVTDVPNDVPADAAPRVEPTKPVALPMTNAVSKPAPPIAVPTVGTSADRTAAAEGEQAFAARLYAKLPQNQNVFFSPTSIRMALGMTYAGARGQTATEMQNALVLKGGSSQQIHDGFAAELRDLIGEPDAPLPANATESEKAEAARKHQTVRVVNRLWGQQGRPFRSDFLGLLQRDYAAPLVPLDFAHDLDHSRQTINMFIADQTEQKIQDLIPSGALKSDSRLVLTNAVYFKASWAQPFGAPHDAFFYVSPSQRITTPLMGVTETFRYGKTAGAEVVELPYASGKMSMMIVLPTERDGLAKIEAGLNDASIATWAKSLSSTPVSVELPKLTMASEMKLAQTLGAMGMPTAFDAKHADFSGMDDSKELFIGDVLHKAFITVDEKGTEAAAATAVVVRAAAAVQQDKPVSFVADHPFLFLIRDVRGAVVFMGRVNDPTKG